MPTKRFENIDPARKEKILDAALSEFSKNGYDNASLNSIIREAGISKGSLYYYFEDKTDLYVTVLKKSMAEVFQEIGNLEEIKSAGDFWAGLENYCKRNIHLAIENPDIMRLIREVYYLSVSGSKTELIAEFYNVQKSTTADIVRRGQEMEAVRKDIPLELLVNIFFSLGEAVDLWLIERWEELTAVEIEQTARLYVDMCRRIADTEYANIGEKE